MQPALFKVLALSVAAVILALTPASILVYWVEGGSEIIHSSPAYTVVYKPSFLNALTGSNETNVKIEVRDERGNPLAFSALLSGPTSDGAVEVGRVEGKGYAVKGIGKYVSEVKRLLRKANSDPERSGMGMLILLSTIIEENGEYYAAADAVSVPIIPGKAVGKEIVVTIKFKPIMKFRVKGEGSSERQPQEPPRTIPNREEPCCVWRLAEVIYTTPTRTTSSGGKIVETEWEYIPVAMTVPGYSLENKISKIEHYFIITLYQADVKYVSFDLSLGFKVGNRLEIHAPGPGYRLDIKKDLKNETIYEINCEIYSTLKSDLSWCRYLVSETYSSFVYTGKFTGDVIFSTGFRGKVWLVRYEYVLVDCSTGQCYETVLNDNVLAVWMEPKFNSYGKIDADWDVDDSPNDYKGVTENVLRILGSNITYKYLTVVKPGGYELPIESIFVNSQASWWFGASIPIGALSLASLAALLGVTVNPVIAAIAVALSVGIEAGSYSGKLYKDIGLLEIHLVTTDPVYGRYAMFKNTYTVKEESADRVVPLIIFNPT